MKLTKEDIEKYGTEEEKKELKETRNLFKKRGNNEYEMFIKVGYAVNDIRAFRDMIEQDTGHLISPGIRQEIIEALTNGANKIGWAITQSRKYF